MLEYLAGKRLAGASVDSALAYQQCVMCKIDFALLYSHGDQERAPVPADILQGVECSRDGGNSLGKSSANSEEVALRISVPSQE